MTSYSSYIRWSNKTVSDAAETATESVDTAVTSEATVKADSIIKRTLTSIKSYFTAVGNAYIEARVRDARYSSSLW